jgi:hypothetical protein
LKLSSFLALAGVIATCTLLLFFMSSSSAQRAAQQTTSPAAPEGQLYPAPTNLQVLPKDLNGAQIRDIMEGWEDDLGVECNTCHVRNPNDLGPNGRPRFNYADDTKEEKKTARVMYTMVDTINANFVSKVPNSGAPVTCGTCHRGHLSPEPYNGDGGNSKPPAQSAPASSH